MEFVDSALIKAPLSPAVVGCRPIRPIPQRYPDISHAQKIKREHHAQSHQSSIVSELLGRPVTIAGQPR